MAYYKLINGMNIVGVITEADFRLFQQKHQQILSCDKDKAQYVQYNDVLYHAQWLRPITSNKYEYVNAELIEIDENEYNILYESLEKHEEIIVEQPPEETEIPPQLDPNTELTVETVRQYKIEEMSHINHRIITEGLDIVTEDGRTHHLSLTDADQRNITGCVAMLGLGYDKVSYHFDDEYCAYLNAEQVGELARTVFEFIARYETYFNSLKQYINSLETIEEISQITYGVEIPEEYQSEVLKDFLAQSGNIEE